jgi:hypothetical protein
VRFNSIEAIIALRMAVCGGSMMPRYGHGRVGHIPRRTHDPAGGRRIEIGRFKYNG